MPQLLSEQLISTETMDPLTRAQLPWLKNPDEKVSAWNIIRENLGKEFYRMTLPVELNGPLNIMQANAQCTEYIGLLNRAADERDSLMRLALVATYCAAGYSAAEKNVAKPFNPLLGETYELVGEEFRLVSEMVCHHPPIGATYC